MPLHESAIRAFYIVFRRKPAGPDPGRTPVSVKKTCQTRNPRREIRPATHLWSAKLLWLAC